MDDLDSRIIEEGIEVTEIGYRAQQSSQASSEMFSNPGNVYNPHATFTSAARDVHYHNHIPARELSLGKREELSTTKKLELPSQTYSRLLMQEGRGYPLLDAGLPNELAEMYQLHGVMIGDVGVVTEDGYFDPLFNICEPAEGDINNCCVPEGFVMLQRPPDNGRNYRHGKAYEPGGWAVSDNVQVTSHPITPGNPSGTYEFECSHEGGAVLALPHGASRKDLVNQDAFLKYASTHGVSWYKFAKGYLGRRVANGSIYLITGYDKTTTWGTAAFFASSTIPRFGMRFARTRWEEPGRAHVKQVQNCPENDTPSENQCTFLRGYKVTLNNRILSRICGINLVETTPMDTIREGPDQRNILDLLGVGDALSLVFAYVLTGRVFSINRSDTTDPNIPWTNYTSLTPIMPSLSLEEIHPSNLVNLHLLSKFPEADLAITHDSVWCSYVKMRKSSADRVSRTFSEHIDTGYIPMQANGAVYLTDAPEPANRVKGDVEASVSRKNPDASALEQGSISSYPTVAWAQYGSNRRENDSQTSSHPAVKFVEASKYPCPYEWCKATFTRPNDLQRHLNTATVHKAGGQAGAAWICARCGEEFSRGDALKRHEAKSGCSKSK